MVPPQPPSPVGLKSSEKFLADARKALHKVNKNLPPSASLREVPSPPSPPSKNEELPEKLNWKEPTRAPVMQKIVSESKEPDWYRYASNSALSICLSHSP